MQSDPFTSIHADLVLIEGREDQVHLTLCQYGPKQMEQGGKLPTIPLQRFAMTPRAYKQVVEALVQFLNQFEEAYGEVHEPRIQRVKPSLVKPGEEN